MTIPELEFQTIEVVSVLDYIKYHLPLNGVLKCHAETNYCYLDIHNDYILKLFPLVQEIVSEENIQMPNYFSTERNHIGAHISVIYPGEINTGKVKIDLQTKVISSFFNFEVTALIKTKTIHKTLFALIVSSLELDNLRVHYQLSQKLNYKNLFLVPFHISLAVI